jgi:predicted ATP-dependent serine protease
MSVGLAFIRALCREGEPCNFLQACNLSEADFSSEERPVIEFASRYVRRYGRVAPRRVVMQRFPELSLPSIKRNETLEFWADQVRHRSLVRESKQQIKRIVRHINNGHDEDAIQAISSFAGNLINKGPRQQVISLAELAKVVKHAHDLKRAGDPNRSKSIPYGFRTLDAASGGAGAGDTIAIVGESGVGKTYLMCRMVVAAQRAGKKALIASMEMNSEQITSRILALRSGLNETHLRRGQLSTLQGDRIIDADIEALEEETDVTVLDGRLVLSIPELEAYARSLNPDVIYVDGAYMLKSAGFSKGKWDGVADSAEQLKIMAGNLGVPVFGTYQFNDKRDIYGGKIIRFLASVIFHIVREEDECNVDDWFAYDTRVIETVKGRFGEFGRIRVEYNMFNTSIEEIERLPNRAPERHRRRRGNNGRQED